MSTRVTLRSLATGGLTGGLVALVMAIATAAPVERPDGLERSEPRPGAATDLPTDGRPIIATVIDVDEDAGRVTLDTPHGRLDLTIGQDLAGRLTPGDEVVLRLTDDEADSPSAAPRETPPMKVPGTRI